MFSLVVVSVRMVYAEWHTLGVSKKEGGFGEGESPILSIGRGLRAPDPICNSFFCATSLQRISESGKDSKRLPHKKRNMTWKWLKGKNPEGKNFWILLRRKQSSAKKSKISRNTLKSTKSDIFSLLQNLLKYLLRTLSFFLLRSFQKFCPLRLNPLAPSGLTFATDMLN